MSDALAGLHEASGKVREIYSFGDTLLMVTSDRMSAFDVIMPTAIPDKGRVLTGLSKFWFDRTADLVPNHLISIDRSDFPAEAAGEPDLAGRSMLVRRLQMLPIECVVRGYLAGSSWKDYRASGEICGHRLPPGLRQSARLPRPIFTPATKAESGHDINIDAAAARSLVGDDELFDRVEQLSIDIYQHAAAHALERGLIIADTKFEFGLDAGGELVLGDEVLTPDSSRFWPADDYEPGRAQAAFDKQFLRDWLEGLDWDKQAPGAGAARRDRRRHPRALRRRLRAPDRRALQRLPTTKRSAAAMKVTVLVRPRDGILDPQGEAVRRSLAGLGYPAADVRAGKVFDLDVDADDAEGARRIADEIAGKVLSNPLIEQYQVEVAG